MPCRRSHQLSRRVTALCACALLALSGGWVAAPTALSANVEGGNSFSELSEKAQQQTTTSTPTTTTATTGSTEPVSNSKSVVILALIAAVVLLLAIAFVIVRDARKMTPAGDGVGEERGSGHDPATRMRKRRAKAKAARQQRKRNR